MRKVHPVGPTEFLVKSRITPKAFEQKIMGLLAVASLGNSDMIEVDVWGSRDRPIAGAGQIAWLKNDLARYPKTSSSEPAINAMHLHIIVTHAPLFFRLLT